ncbi:MAG: DUF4397 domain-containing protein [Burkholderiales bacterium]|nr:DUF4397 domain-containing protein [Burkholderiales bacterium]
MIVSTRTALVRLASSVPAFALALVLAVALLLPACGGSSDAASGQTTVRVLNLATDVGSLNLLVDDTEAFQAVDTDTVSASTTFDAGTYTLKVRMAGSSSNLLSQSHSLSKDQHYLAVVWGRLSAPRLSTLSEDGDDSGISSGNTRLRVMNATIDSGAVDVYLTTSDADLGDSTATVASVASGGISAFKEFSAGTYRLRVTGAGDPADVRLDVASLSLSALQHATLIVTAGTSGVLVHGAVVPQLGTLALSKNQQSRVRVVAGVEAAGSVGVSLGARTLAGSIRSPSVGPYAVIDAGTATLAVRVNGVALATQAQEFQAGSDYTLLVYGAAGAPQVQRITDDNRLPTTSSRMRIRMINGTSLADPLALSVDYAAVASDVPAGYGSSYVTLASNASARVDVTAPSAASPLFSDTDANLQALSVYTVFMLGGNSVPTGVMRKER